MRQEFAAAAGERSCRAYFGYGGDPRGTGDRGKTREPVRLRISGSGPVVLAHRDRERSASARGGRISRRTAAGALRGAARFGRASEIQGRLSARIVRWNETARRDRQGVGMERVHSPDGRTVQRAR